MQKNNKKNNYKVYYSEFTRTKEIDKIFIQCSELIKLNHLLKVGLISKPEYDKVRSCFDLIANL